MFSRRKFIIIDSILDKVITIYSPTQLLKRWKYFDEDDSEISYDGYAIVPQFKVTTKAKFTIEQARFVMD